jgi:hypothetical protein
LLEPLDFWKNPSAPSRLSCSIFGKIRQLRQLPTELLDFLKNPSAPRLSCSIFGKIRQLRH